MDGGIWTCGGGYYCSTGRVPLLWSAYGKTGRENQRMAHMGVYRSGKGIAERHWTAEAKTGLRYVLCGTGIYMGCETHFI